MGTFERQAAGLGLVLLGFTVGWCGFSAADQRQSLLEAALRGQGTHAVVEGTAVQLGANELRSGVDHLAGPVLARSEWEEWQETTTNSEGKTTTHRRSSSPSFQLVPFAVNTPEAQWRIDGSLREISGCSHRSRVGGQGRIHERTLGPGARVAVFGPRRGGIAEHRISGELRVDCGGIASLRSAPVYSKVLWALAGIAVVVVGFVVFFTS